MKKLLQTVLAVCLVILCLVGLVACHRKPDDNSGTGHTHDIKAVAPKAETCTQQGNIAYWYCQGCGKYFANAIGSSEITLQTTLLPPLGHSYVKGICSRCGEPEYQQDGIYFTAIVQNDQIVSYAVVGAANKDATELTIPAVYNQLPVTQIDENAFANYEKLQSVVLQGSNLQTIGKGAFSNCVALTSVEIPASVLVVADKSFYQCTSLQSVIFANGSLATTIGASAMSGCSSLAEVQIPNCVTTIGGSAFANCTALSSVTFENGSQLKTIENQAFIGCSALTQITIPTGVTALSNGIFQNCSSLAYVNFANNSKLKKVESNAFSQCVALQSVVFGLNSLVEAIESSAFVNCPLLENILIPVTVNSIGSKAFENCPKLTINCEAARAQSGWKDWEGYVSVVYGRNNIITNSQFDYVVRANSAYLTSYKDSNPAVVIAPVIDGYDVVSFGEIFRGNTTITSVKIPSSIKEIAPVAFQNCTGLTAVELSSSVKKIGAQAFENCTSLTKIQLPASVAEIGYHAFYNCGSLTVYSEALRQPEAWHDKWQENCTVVWDSKNSLSETTFIFDGLIYEVVGSNVVVAEQSGVTVAKNVVVPSSVTHGDISYNVVGIANGAFYNCSTINSLQLPASVTSIGNYAFYRCSMLRNIIIPDDTSINNIGEYAFYGTNIQSITIPAAVRNIQNGTFRSCGSLSSVVFAQGSTLISIEENAFADCTSLQSITVPQGVVAIGNNAFYYCRTLGTVTFAQNSILQIIGDNAFNSCSSLHTVAIPASVNQMGEGAFAYCDSLTDVVVEDNSQLTTVGDYAFYYCQDLAFLSWGSNSKLQSLGSYVLTCCYELESLSLPASLQSIGDNDPFAYCSKLIEITVDPANTNFKSADGNLYSYDGTLFIQYAIAKQDQSFTLPATVTTISDAAFGGSRNLKVFAVESGSQLQTISNNGFALCSALEQVELPATLQSVASGAFNNCTNIKKVYIHNLSAWCSIDFSDLKAAPLAHGAELYLNGQLVEDVMFGADVLTINQYAFYGCTSLKSVTFATREADTENQIAAGYQVQVIYQNSFAHCVNLKSIYIPATVTLVGDGAFEGCQQLTIYCQAASKPSTWDVGWNKSNCQVLWNRQEEQND